jgi:hypothetical protein
MIPVTYDSTAVNANAWTNAWIPYTYTVSSSSNTTNGWSPLNEWTVNGPYISVSPTYTFQSPPRKPEPPPGPCSEEELNDFLNL